MTHSHTNSAGLTSNSAGEIVQYQLLVLFTWRAEQVYGQGPSIQALHTVLDTPRESSSPHSAPSLLVSPPIVKSNSPWTTMPRLLVRVGVDGNDGVGGPSRSWRSLSFRPKPA